MSIKYHIILLKTQQTEDKYSNALIDLKRQYSNFKFTTIEPIKFKQLSPSFEFDPSVPLVFTSPRAVVYFSNLTPNYTKPLQIFTVGPSTTDTAKNTVSFYLTSEFLFFIFEFRYVHRESNRDL